MKKFVLLLLVIVFLPAQAAHAQLTVAAPALEALTASFGGSQVAQLIKQVTEQVANGVTLVSQLYQMEQQAEKALKNLRRMGEIHSWDDFMSWYNRQLYLESQTIDTFSNLGLKVGGKNYKFSDMEGMASAMNDTYADFWHKEFTEDQRKELWTSMGLTPANYVYVQTWKEKEKNLAKRFLMSSTIQNNEYMQSMTRNNSSLRRLAEDALKSDDDKMDAKELEAISAETAINTNKVLNDIKMTLAEMQELQALKLYQENTPYDGPPVSESFDKVYFEALK